MFIYSQKKRFSTVFSASLLIIVSLLLSGCAGNKAIDGDPSSVELSESDPYERMNRKIFQFNASVDEYIAHPISEAYLYITPQFVQTGIANFFNNLKDINVVINDVLQGKLQQGAEDSGRFLLNTTAGFAGLIDVASEVGLERHEEDFAQTLAVWGTPKGPYLVLPILGPSTSRGIPGGIFDTAANPATYIGIPIQLVQMLNARANAGGALKFIDEAALDSYVFTRESFLQHRKYLVTDGNSEVTDDVMALEDDFYDDDELLDDELLDEELLDGVDIKEAKVDKVMEQQLELTSTDVDSFKKASESFDGAVKSFDDTSWSFEQAGEKIEKMD
ncbi:MAG: VacJ family lipoprotein [Methylococcales symbiont of Hymedesmia sp. n. MRB-2018]|nr:MAG: VacJ family lipoprotein [Methylococcales symbiont of Hymedesmia sp. n. MRB-2018]